MDFFQSEKFRPHVEDLLARHRVPGLAVAVVKNETVASAGYGLASINPPRACTPDTIFDIASASKSLTGASIALLVEDNERYPDVQYDGIMSKILAGDFVLSEPVYHDGITVDDVLGHRSGMAPHEFSHMSPRAEQPDDAKSITRNWRNLEAAAPIRSRYMYSDLMFTTLTQLVETKTCRPFSSFLQETFFTPLTMDSTNLQPHLAQEKGLGDRIATGYTWDTFTSSYKSFQSPDRPEGQGAGSVMTSVNDYIKWVGALMRKEAPINEHIYENLIRSRTFIETDHNPKWMGPYTSQTVVGAGLEMMYYRGHLVVFHNGLTQGFASRHFFIPGFQVGAVVLANSAAAGRIIEILCRELIDDALGLPEAERHDWCGSIALKTAEDGDRAAENRKSRVLDQLRSSLCSDGVTASLTTDLAAFTGRYWHAGYRGLTVKADDTGKELVIDATDRSQGFTATLEHVCQQTNFIAHLCDFLDGGETPIRAEFVVEGGKAQRFGLALEDELDMIWFDRTA